MTPNIYSSFTIQNSQFYQAVTNELEIRILQ